MTGEFDEESVIRRVREGGQEHVLRWLGELDEARRTRFLLQLGRVDFGLLKVFRKLVTTPPTEVSFTDMEPAPVERLPLTSREREPEERIIALGEKALRAGRVTALTVAGGQGTRLRYGHAKGMYPITPLRGKSLFETFAEQIRAARKRYRCGIPWLVMTSPANDAETRRFFRENDFFQLGRDSVEFFVQETYPILDRDGNMMLAEKDRLLAGPGGHGDTYTALARAGLLDKLRNVGRDLISYFQVDNPLVTAIDPRFIGHHLAKDADFSCKVVPKRGPTEGLGIAVLQCRRPAVVEYIDVPDRVAVERGPNGRLCYLYGSIAIHIIDVPFIERVAHQNALRWHVATKQYEYLGRDGQKKLSAPGGCYKFERFIFDALPLADNCAFVEVQRTTEFAPVKAAEGEDSPARTQHAMQRMWLQWLQAAGVKVAVPKDFSTPVIEISPLFAASAEELKERVKPGWEPEFPLVLEP